jgi:hypothetical protein
MIGDYIKSTIENIRERIRNPFNERNTTPFAGAFIIALIIYNWHLFFSLINFDHSETRTSKIKIISDYLRAENWIYRIGYPIIIAFGSIIFFYLFNNISLGITTIFNRWVKATILHYTDRSKIIAREEFEKSMTKMNRLRRDFEDLKRIFAESQSDLEEYKTEIKEKDGKLTELTLANETLKIEKEKLSSELKDFEQNEKGFKVLYARYGKGDIYKDVTKIVVDLFMTNERFLVRNQELGGDPIKHIHKELFIVYSLNSEIHPFTAKEFYEIQMTAPDGLLASRETEQSKIVYSRSNTKNLTSVENLFPGRWELEYKGKLNGVEEVEIRDGNKYFSKSKNDTSFKHSFNLENISINIEQNKLQFRKVSVPPNVRNIDCFLSIVELGKQYDGIEDNGDITVSYEILQ